MIISGKKIEYAESEYDGAIDEAISAFKKEHPDFRIESIGDKDVYDWCEMCDCPLFFDSAYYVDEEGNKWCKSHGKGNE